MPHTGFPYARRTKYPPSSGLQSVLIPSPISPHIYSTSHCLLPCVSSFKPRSLPLPMPTCPLPLLTLCSLYLLPPEYFCNLAAVVCVSPWEKPSFFPSMSPTPGLLLGVWCAGTFAGHAAGNTECRDWGLVGRTPQVSE